MTNGEALRATSDRKLARVILTCVYYGKYGEKTCLENIDEIKKLLDKQESGVVENILHDSCLVDKLLEEVG